MSIRVCHSEWIGFVRSVEKALREIETRDGRYGAFAMARPWQRLDRHEQIVTRGPTPSRFSWPAGRGLPGALGNKLAGVRGLPQVA